MTLEQKRPRDQASEEGCGESISKRSCLLTLVSTLISNARIRKLEVWQKAMDWVEHIYGVSSTPKGGKVRTDLAVTMGGGFGRL